MRGNECGFTCSLLVTLRKEAMESWEVAAMLMGCGDCFATEMAWAMLVGTTLFNE